jgi:hypothetical protein
MIAKGYEMSEASAKKQDQFIVRFPDGMRDKIKESAEQNNRSMNAEIIAALDEWITKPNADDAQLEKLRTMARDMNAERQVVNHRLAEILDKISSLESVKK